MQEVSCGGGRAAMQRTAEQQRRNPRTGVQIPAAAPGAFLKK